MHADPLLRHTVAAVAAATSSDGDVPLHDFGHERVKAWAKVLEEPPRRTAASADPIGGAAGDCQTARSGLAIALRTLDARPAARSQDGLSREWVACLDEILAIADRACALLAVAAEGDAAAPWHVWESQAAR